jgi:hypothetical protein
MTGPEHYAEAERLLTDAFDEVRHGDPAEAVVLAQAQVHATLALAAATALKSDTGSPSWADVAGTSPLISPRSVNPMTPSQGSYWAAQKSPAPRRPDPRQWRNSHPGGQPAA